MLYPSINVLRTKADSKYTLVSLAAKRARDLIDGKPPLVNLEINKPVSIATREIADDLISYTRDFSTEEEAAWLAEHASAVREAAAAGADYSGNLVDIDDEGGEEASSYDTDDENYVESGEEDEDYWEDDEPEEGLTDISEEDE